MDGSKSPKVASFRDLTEKQDVTFQGEGSFQIGLSRAGCLAVVSASSEDELCMSLLCVTVSTDGVVLLSSTNKDLPCIVNGSQELEGEIILMNGTKLEVADKTLMFIDGPIPKLRRKLPQTPGQPLALIEPPQKPARASDILTVTPGKEEEKEDEEEREERKWLETSWCKIQLPSMEQELFNGLKTPEQISILAGSYFCRQIRLFTDANLTTEMLDDIFQLFKSAVVTMKQVFLDYLNNISQLICKSPGSHQSRPMHGPAIRLLTELLSHFIEPLTKVILILDLIRTFSHFDANLVTMVSCRTTAPVLGSMAAYLREAGAQQYCMDILGRIAKYRPKMKTKAPLREAGVEMVVRGMEYHHGNVEVNRSGCRVLANLSNTLVEVANDWLDSEPYSTDVAEELQKYEALLDFLFEKSVPVVQSRLEHFSSDLGIKTEGRRLLYNYTKLAQLKQKKKLWSEENQCPSIEIHVEEADTDSTRTETWLQTVTTTTVGQGSEMSLLGVNTDHKPSGILKKSRSYECLRRKDRRLSFTMGTSGGSDSEVTSSEEEEEDEAEEETARIPEHLDREEEFSSHLVTQLKRTLSRQASGEYSGAFQLGNTNNSSSSSGSSSRGGQEDVKLETQDFLLSASGVHENGTSTCISDLGPLQQREESEARTGSPEQVLTGETDGLVSSQVMTTLDVSSIDTSNQMENIEAHPEIPTVPGTLSDDVAETVTSDAGKRRSQQMEVGDTRVSITTVSTPITVATVSTPITVTTVSTPITVTTVPSTMSVTTVSTPPELSNGGVKSSGAVDVVFLARLMRCQIIVYVSSLVCEGEESRALLVIDQPIRELIENSAAPRGLVEFAGNQYEARTTLMDLDPAIVISVIDAVRYRTLTCNLLQSSLLSVTRAINQQLQQTTVNITMLFFKAVFANPNLVSMVTEEKFMEEFRTGFLSATEKLEKSVKLDEIRKKLLA